MMEQHPPTGATSGMMSHYELHNGEPMQNTTATGTAKAVAAGAAVVNPRRRKGKDVVVIVKSYYMSHSLRYSSCLLGTTKPEELAQLSNSTWYEIQAQLEPLIRRHLFLPKSYLFVPILCMMAAVGWFFCFSIASVHKNNTKNNDENAASRSTTSTVLICWMILYLFLLALICMAFARWVQKRNQPVDEELREVCLELSRSKTQAEGFRLEYHKTGYSTLHDQGIHLFATRVLRFVPLPIPSKICVPQSQSQQELEDGPVLKKQSSSLSNSTDSSEYPTLQSFSSIDFAPFPSSDIILENLASLLFVLVIFQCVASLP